MRIEEEYYKQQEKEKKTENNPKGRKTNLIDNEKNNINNNPSRPRSRKVNIPIYPQIEKQQSIHLNVNEEKMKKITSLTDEYNEFKEKYFNNDPSVKEFLKKDNSLEKYLSSVVDKIYEKRKTFVKKGSEQTSSFTKQNYAVFDEICKTFWSEQMKMINQYMQKVEEIMRERDSALKESFLLKEKLMLMSQIRNEQEKIRDSLGKMFIKSGFSPVRKSLNYNENFMKSPQIINSDNRSTLVKNESAVLDNKLLHVDKSKLIYSKPRTDGKKLSSKKEIISIDPEEKEVGELIAETKFVHIEPKLDLKKDDKSFFETWKIESVDKPTQKLEENEIINYNDEKNDKNQQNEEKTDEDKEIKIEKNEENQKYEKSVSLGIKQFSKLEEFLLSQNDETNNNFQKSGSEKIRKNSPEKIEELEKKTSKITENDNMNQSIIKQEDESEIIQKSEKDELKSKEKSENDIILIDKKASGISYIVNPKDNSFIFERRGSELASKESAKHMIPLSLKSYHEKKTKSFDKSFSINQRKGRKLTSDIKPLEVIKEINTMNSSSYTRTENFKESEKPSENPSSKNNENDLYDFAFPTETSETNKISRKHRISFLRSPSQFEKLNKRGYSNQDITSMRLLSFNENTDLRQVDIIPSEVVNRYSKKALFNEKHRFSQMDFRTSYK